MKTLLIIDGNAIMHRAFHAIPPFKTKAGIPTNVIYGFLGMLHRSVEVFQPTHIAICFDTPAKTFRQKLLESYQAQRPEMHDDFKEQIPLLKSLLSTAGIYQSELDGLEADDIIGTVTQTAKKHGIRTLILTGDKDIMQLVNHHVFVVAPKMGLTEFKLYDEPEVEKKLGVLPTLIPDYKALAGDPSDNYKGAEGIGPKTAVKLLEEYHSVENLLKHINDLEPKYRKIVERDHDQILLSKKIATIITDADINFSLTDAEFHGFPDALREEFAKYEMRSLLDRFFGKTKKENVREEPKKKKKTEPHKDQIGMF